MQTKSGKPLFPIGIGTWMVAMSFEADPAAKYKGVTPIYGNEDKEIEAIRYSISKGQNHIDCAELYGAFYTDEVIGQALQGLPREDLFIADKLWRTSLEKGLVRPTVQQMLQKLRTDYIDLLYIHSPFDETAWQEAIPQIDELIDEGIVRYFGVSNFTVEQMQEAIQISSHPLVVTQMNYNVLYKDEVDEKFRDYCKENGIQIVAYQPVKRQEVLANPVIQEIAKKHDATPAQIALAWLLSKGVLPIPKAMQKSHIDGNVHAISIQLSAEDLRKLDALGGSQ